MTIPRILIIAGSDSGGGAGIQADIKTVTMLGGHAMTAITAITAQNSTGVQAVHPVPTDIVLAQVESCLSDFGADAIKIGMIGSADTAGTVADRLAEISPRIPIVFDPVMVATSGGVLADEPTIAAFERLTRLATVTTPNRDELERLGGVDALRSLGSAVLEKGGHGDGQMITDRLVMAYSSDSASWMEQRIDSPHTHGTGCTLSTAIAVGLAEKMSLQDSVARARRFVRLAIERAPDLVESNGPMGHGQVNREDVER